MFHCYTLINCGYALFWLCGSILCLCRNHQWIIIVFILYSFSTSHFRISECNHNFFVFQAKVKRSTSHSSSQECMKGLLKGVTSLGKLIFRKRRPCSEPFPMDNMGSPVHEVPSFYASTENLNEGKTGCGWDQAGSSLCVIDDVCYEAQSPDEAALVHAAKAYGFTLKERTPHHVTVQLPQGTLMRFDVLDVLAFDSNRRRMSIIVRHPETKKIVMYTKGADSSIMERLDTSFKGKTQRQVLLAIFDHYMVQRNHNNTILPCINSPRKSTHEKWEDKYGS